MTKPKPTVVQLAQLIGNPEVYAVQQEGGKGYFPVYEPLTPSVLRRHLDGELTVGTYVVWGENAQTLVFDVDTTDKSETDAVYDALLSLGIPDTCIGVEFSGSKGYHVWILLGRYDSASKLRRLGQAALALSGASQVEVFPKQDSVRKLGNLVKLPGGIHRKTGDWSYMLTPWPNMLGPARLNKILEGIPETAVTGGRAERPPSMECMAVIQEGPQKGWRNHGLFHYATMLHRASLSSENVRLLVEQANQRCAPGPLDALEVDALLESAAHSGPICSQLPSEAQCSECPVRRGKGLYCRPGQIAHGAEGEVAVVELGRRRKNGDIEIIHPDLHFCIASLRNVPPRG